MIYTRKYMREAAADPETQEDVNAAEVVDNIEANVADEILGMEPDQVADVTVEVPEDKQVDIAIDPVSDPVSECYAIMFEEEYNYNSIMQAIGMYELSEAARGRDVIFEAVDVKAYITKAWEWLKGIATKVAEAFMRLIGDMKVKLTGSNKFATEHEAEIKAGWSKLDCEINDIDLKQLAIQTKKNTRLDNLVSLAKDKNKDNMGDSPADEDETNEFDLDNAKTICGFEISTTDVSKLADEMKAKIIGEKVNIKNAKNTTAESVIESMKTSREFKMMNDLYKSSKDYYTGLMSQMNILEKANKDWDDAGKFMKFSAYVIERIRFAAKVEQVHKAVIAKACKISDYQTRWLAAQAVKAAAPAKEEKKEEKKPEVQHNSAKMFNASKTFGSIDLI